MLAWMIILATIPVGLAGVALEHTFRTVFSKPLLTASFLFVNGFILLAGERARRRSADREAQEIAADLQAVTERQKAGVAAGTPGGGGRHSSGQRAMKQQHASLAVEADQRIVRRTGWLGARCSWRPARRSWPCCRASAGTAPSWSPGCSGRAVTGGTDAAAVLVPLLSAPVILAAGLLKSPDLTGPLGAGDRGPILFGSLLSGVERLLRAQVPGPLTSATEAHADAVRDLLPGPAGQRSDLLAITRIPGTSGRVRSPARVTGPQDRL